MLPGVGMGWGKGRKEEEEAGRVKGILFLEVILVVNGNGPIPPEDSKSTATKRHANNAYG